MDILFKNERSLKFYSFIYNNQSFSFVFFNFLVNGFNEQESLSLRSGVHFDELNYEFKISELDFYYIYDKSIEVKQDLFSKKNVLFSNSLKRNFNDFKEELSYIIKKEEDSLLIIDSFLLRNFIRDNLENLTLENPFFRTESLKHKMLNLINKKIDGNYYQPMYEQVFFKLIKDNYSSFDHIYYKDISKKNKLNILKSIDDNISSLNIDVFEIINFLNKLLEELEQIVKDILIITDSLRNRVNNILKIVEKIDDSLIKKKIISKYLSSSMKTLSQFYAKEKADTIQTYMTYLFNIIDICMYYIESKNIEHNLIETKDIIRINYLSNLDKLKQNIQLLTKKIKEKEDNLIFEEKMKFYFSSVQESNYDSKNKKAEKDDNLSSNLLKKYSEENSLLTKTTNAFSISYKKDELLENILNVFKSKNKHNTCVLSKEEKLEQEINIQETENEYLNLISFLEREKQVKKDIIIKLTDYLDENITLTQTGFIDKIDELFYLSQDKWLSKGYLLELKNLLSCFNIDLDRIDTLQTLSKIIERKI